MSGDVREFHWRATGWKATAIWLALLMVTFVPWFVGVMWICWAVLP